MGIRLALAGLCAVIAVGCGGDKPLKDLFRRKQPVLIKPIKTLVPGMALADAKKVNSALFQKGGFRSLEWGGGGKGMRFEGEADATGTTLHKVTVTFGREHQELKKILDRVWGESEAAQVWTIGGAGGKPVAVPTSVWFAPDGAWKVTYLYTQDKQRGTKRQLIYEAFTDAKEVIGFERKTPVIGKTADELSKAHPTFEAKKGGKVGVIVLPSLTWFDGPTKAHVTLVEGKAKKFELRFDKPLHKDAKPGILEVIAKTYGPAKPLEVVKEGPWEADRKEFLHADKPDRVILKDFGETWILSVEEPPPPSPPVDGEEGGAAEGAGGLQKSAPDGAKGTDTPNQVD